MAYGKSIELFLANGTADSLIIAELSNWDGKAIKIPRIEVISCKRKDIQGAGVYFLFCKNKDDDDAVYIGESENVYERLSQHIRDYNAEKEDYYWTTAVAFFGKNLNKALIRYLEDRFVSIARNTNRYTILTKNTYSNTVMKESDIAVMEEFIANVKILINALGYKVLEPKISVQDNSKTKSDDKILYINQSGIKARGIITTEGFVLLAGSDVRKKIAEKSITNNVIELRKKYIAEGKIKDFKTTEDLILSSSSFASSFVLGNRCSGPQSWKNKDGVTLKEIEEKEEKEFKLEDW